MVCTATESELKNELQVRQKQLSSLRLENEQLITSFKSKRGKQELNYNVCTLSINVIKMQLVEEYNVILLCLYR